MNNHETDSMRLTLPSLLAHKLNGKSPQYGKTVLMKMAYLLQEVYKVPLGYRFTLYTYGPYSSEVLSDLDRSKFREWVNVNYNDNEVGYEITAGPKSGTILELEEILRITKAK